MTTSTNHLTVLRRRDVEALVGLSRSSIYMMMAQGRFPRPVRVGARAVAWRLTDIQTWLADCQEAGPEVEPAAAGGAS